MRIWASFLCYISVIFIALYWGINIVNIPFFGNIEEIEGLIVIVFIFSNALALFIDFKSLAIFYKPTQKKVNNHSNKSIALNVIMLFIILISCGFFYYYNAIQGPIYGFYIIVWGVGFASCIFSLLLVVALCIKYYFFTNNIQKAENKIRVRALPLVIVFLYVLLFSYAFSYEHIERREQYHNTIDEINNANEKIDETNESINDVSEKIGESNTSINIVERNIKQIYGEITDAKNLIDTLSSVLNGFYEEVCGDDNPSNNGTCEGLDTISTFLNRIRDSLASINKPIMTSLSKLKMEIGTIDNIVDSINNNIGIRNNKDTSTTVYGRFSKIDNSINTILNEIKAQKYPMRFILPGFEKNLPKDNQKDNLSGSLKNDSLLSLVDDFIKGLKPCADLSDSIKIKIYGFASHTGRSRSNNLDLANRRGKAWYNYIERKYRDDNKFQVSFQTWNTYEEMRFHIPLQDNMSDEKDVPEDQHIFTRSARMYIDPGGCGRVD